MAATWRHRDDSPRPVAVGILALEIYFPTQKVSMADLEAADGCPGKYTRGLGQESMAFTSDREDPVSMALTVTSSLMEKYGVDPGEVGHLQVATESAVDRSKSIKSHLMTLFQRQRSQRSTTVNGIAARQPLRGPPAEGVDCTHACYGATAAILAAVAWVESRRWDGRLALVVATDVALYEPGTPARPTGGCGAAAILIGPNAPLVLDPLWYGNTAEHAWDFYKPLGRLPYPAVDGRTSLSQYLAAVGHCGLQVAARLEAAGVMAPGQGLLPAVSYYVAHAPFAKLAAKGLTRLALMDAMRAAEAVKGEATSVAATDKEGETAAVAGEHANEAAGEEAVTAEAAAATAGAKAAAASPSEATAGASGAGPAAEGTATKAEEAAEVAEPCPGEGRQETRQEQEAAGAGAGAAHQDWVREWVQEQQQQPVGAGGEAATAATAIATAATGTLLATHHTTAPCDDLAPGGPDGSVDLRASSGGGECRSLKPTDSASQAAAALGSEKTVKLAAEGDAAGDAAATATEKAATATHATEGDAETATEFVGATNGHSGVSAVGGGWSNGNEKARELPGWIREMGLELGTDDGDGAAAAAGAANADDNRRIGGSGGTETAVYSTSLPLKDSCESYATWRLYDKVLEASLLRATAATCGPKGHDAAWLQKQLGNSYTACVWHGLSSLLCRRGTDLAGQRLLLFSFGSGTVASLFSLVPREGEGGGGGGGGGGGESIGGDGGGGGNRSRCPGDVSDVSISMYDKGGCKSDGNGGRTDTKGKRRLTGDGSGESGKGKEVEEGGEGEGGGSPADPRFTLAAMKHALNLDERLAARVGRTVSYFDQVTAVTAAAYGCPVPYEPVGDLEDVRKGTYYLVRVDEQGRRWYERK